MFAIESNPALAYPHMIYRVEGTRVTPVGMFRDEAVALRTLELLNRHGMVDTPMPSIDE